MRAEGFKLAQYAMELRIFPFVLRFALHPGYPAPGGMFSVCNHLLSFHWPYFLQSVLAYFFFARRNYHHSLYSGVCTFYPGVFFSLSLVRFFYFLASGSKVLVPITPRGRVSHCIDAAPPSAPPGGSGRGEGGGRCLETLGQRAPVLLILLPPLHPK